MLTSFVARSLRRPAVLAAAFCVAVVAAGLGRAALSPRAVQDATGAQQTLVAYCTPHGLEPDETTIRPGQYSLMVRNRSGLDSLTFTVETAGQAPTTLGTINAGENIFDVNVPLAPGTYVVRVVDHPDWQSVVTITP